MPRIEPDKVTREDNIRDKLLDGDYIVIDLAFFTIVLAYYT